MRISSSEVRKGDILLICRGKPALGLRVHGKAKLSESTWKLSGELLWLEDDYIRGVGTAYEFIIGEEVELWEA